MEYITPREQAKKITLQESKPMVYEKIQRYDDMLAEGKSIAILVMQYSYACNFGCSHCSVAGFRKDKTRRKLTPADVKMVFDQAHAYGIAQCGITGGEPAVFPDIDEVIKAIDPQRFHIQFDTNGLLMTAEYARHIKAMGVDKVQISIDGMIAEEHDAFRRHPGSHAAALNAIRNVQDAGA
jgi:MoaA/NifB/PqqE/SkfB family radical SAM enzyme